MNVKIISAGAGSGKTYRLTSELVALLKSGAVRPSGVVATTFTNKAAAELHERVRTRLIEEGLTGKANELGHALIGTVHSLGVKLLSRFALEAGISPNVDIIADEDQNLFFSQSMATVMTREKVGRIEALAGKLSLSAVDNRQTDWRKMLMDITQLSRANDFSTETLNQSKKLSIEEFAKFLKPDEETQAFVNPDPEAWNARLIELIKTTVQRLNQNEDTTKKTQQVVDDLQRFMFQLSRSETLSWTDWAKISKMTVGVKSKADVEDLIAFTRAHYLHPAFQQDLHDFISEMFDLATAALTEYANFKKQRGLIDYTDMEVMVSHLLNRHDVQHILSQELDLLMVDEFQDTNPLQLDIFLKLSRLAKQSVWVGDPKQSIYGFRGAEPALIQAIIEQQGGLAPENIQPFSWRSRAGLVNFSNAVFTTAFEDMPAEQVALTAKRQAAEEPPETGPPVVIWELYPADPSAKVGTAWMNDSIAQAISILLTDPPLVLPKGEKTWRRARPGDVAVLCRSNRDCQQLAGALHSTGLKASVARAGLLETAEARLVTACLRLILNKYDALAKAELWYLSGEHNLELIVKNRLDFLNELKDGNSDAGWGSEVAVIAHINRLRTVVGELSASEILQLLLDELDLRRIIIRWGNAEQRLSNVEEILKITQDYEDACHRRNAAASLAGFLLWLNELAQAEHDNQGATDAPDSVKVLTYHKSKGLEYPIVICNNLWQSSRADLWGVSIVRDPGPIDLTHPLAGRWLRLWVNPYGQQYQKTVLAERLGNSTAQQLETQRALEEEKRLLYVGFTRARDYLVLPTSAKKAPQWLNRVMNGNDDMTNALELLLNGELKWKGQVLNLEVRKFEIGAEPTNPEVAQPDAFLYFDSPAGKAEFQAYFLDISEWKPAFSVKEIAQYAPALTEQTEEVGRALSQLFRSVRLDYGAQDLKELVQDQQRLLPSLKALLSEENLLQRINAFRMFILERLEGDFEYLKPVSGELNSKKFQLELDLVVLSGQSLSILQHGFLPLEGKQKDKAWKYETAKLHLSKLAVSNLYSISSCRCFLHSPLSGQLMQIEF